MYKIKNLCVILTTVFLLSCKNDAQETTKQGNFNVELLFEKDGCKVYRFMDGVRYIYWSNCNGGMQSDVYKSTGKSVYIEHMQSLTNTH